MARIDDLEAENKALKAKLTTDRIADSFNRSRFVADRLTVPADILFARFGAAFTVENDRVVAVDANKNLIQSRDRPGEIATFDEAIEILVAAYPHRDSILKATGGAGGAHAGNGAAGKTISRDVWNQLSPLDQRDALVGRQLKLVD